MIGKNYAAHPDNAATFSDDSNGWEAAPPRPHLTFARIAQLHQMANASAGYPYHPHMPNYFDSLPVHEADIFGLEYFKARIRLTHPTQPPCHSAKLTGPEATLGTIEHLRPYLLDGTALFGSAPVAVAITRPALLASHNPAGQIDAAIAWLQAFKAAGLNPTTNTNPGQA